MSSTSEQIVRKLLRAIEDDEGKDQKAVSVRQRKRQKLQKQDNNIPQPVVNEEQALHWHVQTLLAVDRKLETKGSKNSNAAAFKKTMRRKLQVNKNNTPTRLKPGSCSRTPAGQQQQPEPTSNKKRYQKQKQEKKMNKLKNALNVLEKKKHPKKGSSTVAK